MDKPGAEWLSQGLSKAGLLPLSLFSCLSLHSVKFLGLLLFLYEQTSNVLPRTLGVAGLEMMPGDASEDNDHMVLRNLCTTAPKPNLSVATSFTTGCPTRSITKRASWGGHPHPISLDFLHLCNFPGLWPTPGAIASHGAGKAEREKEGKVFGNVFGFSNFRPASTCILLWQYNNLFKMITVHFSFNQLHGAILFWSNSGQDTSLATTYKEQKKRQKPLIIDRLYFLHWCCSGDVVHPLTSQTSWML